MATQFISITPSAECTVVHLPFAPVCSIAMEQRMESQISGCSQQELQVCDHHTQRAACHSRAKYREGRRPKAVRVYTINLESRYLLVQGVPAIGVMKELIDHFALFGTIEEYHVLDEYPAEEFTEVYLIKFQRLQTARVAKRKLDERSFFGGVLHVCYAPEFESVQETREKLQDRRRFIARVTADKDYLLSRKPDPNPAAPKAFEQHYQHETSHFSISEACTSSTDQYQQQCYQFEPSLSQPASTNPTVSSPGDHLQSELCLPPSVSDSMKTNSSFTHETKWMQGLQPGTNNNTTYSQIQQRSNPSDNGINRFMPRTTQLQERKRKRDQADSCSLFGTGLDEEIIIGPKLPEIPKVDMEDDSLNVSANTIRSKLKKVSLMPITAPEMKQNEDTAVNPLTKPRRRI